MRCYAIPNGRDCVPVNLGGNVGRDEVVNDITEQPLCKRFVTIAESVWVASRDDDGMRHSAEDLSYTVTRTILIWRHRVAPFRPRRAPGPLVGTLESRHSKNDGLSVG